MPVRPQLDAGPSPRSGTPGRTRRASSSSAPLRRTTSATTPRSRPGAASRSRRRRRRPGGPAAAPESSSSRCSSASSATSSGWRRQRASGRRRSAPSPVHGASTSTRSKPPSGEAGLAAVADVHGRPASPAVALRDQLGPVRRASRRRQRARRRAAASAASSAALPPGPGAQVQPALVRPVQRRARPARARTAGCPRPARRPAARARGSGRPGRPRRVQVHAVGRVRRDRRRRSSRRAPRRSISPGQATQVHAGPVVVGGQRGREAVAGRRASASAKACAIHSGWAVRERQVADRVGARVRGELLDPGRLVVLATPAQHGVDEARRIGSRPCRAPGRRWPRPRRAAGIRVRSNW